MFEVTTVSWSFFRAGADAGWEGGHPVWGSLPLLFSVLCSLSSGDCISYFFHLCAKNTQQAAYKGKASLCFMGGKVFPVRV